MFALVLSFGNKGVWAIQCGCELVLVEKEDVRLETRGLIFLVVDELDLLEVGGHVVWRCVCFFE